MQPKANINPNPKIINFSMHNFIVRNWLILAIASLLVAVYVTIFDGFVAGKAYMFYILTILFGAVYYFRLKGGK